MIQITLYWEWEYYLEGGQDDIVRLISGHLAGGNIADQPSVALSGLKLADNGERWFLSKGAGSGFDGSLAASSLTQKETNADSLGNTDNSEKASGGGGGQKGGGSGDGGDTSGGGGGGLQDQREGSQSWGGKSQSDDENLVHLDV